MLRRRRARAPKTSFTIQRVSHLFDSFTQRDVTLRNRIAVSPMCMYSAVDGVPKSWHMVHLGSRAVGGAGLVMAEASGVEPRGRISPNDTGIWNEAQMEAWQPIVAFIAEQGAVPAIQLAHAGRKAGTAAPWQGGDLLGLEEGGWENVSASPVPFLDRWRAPHELTAVEIAEIVQKFAQAATWALAAGFQVAELHGAHGYLINQFLSPLSNRRTDEYGGSLANRMRFAIEVAEAVRTVWPERLPLWIRLSVTDWVDDGWTVEDSVELAKELKDRGVDLVDCSSGGSSATARIPVGPGYQVPFAEQVRREAGIATGAVGLITTPQQADAIIRDGQADVVLLARELLRDPYFPRRAARELGQEITPPQQYGRAW